MKITRFETWLCSHVHPEDSRWYGGRWDQDARGMRFHAVLLRVHTDEGITGLGEANPWGDCRAMEAAIRRLEERFRGRDPFDVEKLIVHTADAETNRALAAVDLALWDIVGKATETPVFRLLARDGDVQPQGIRTYASGGVGYNWHDNPEQVVEEWRRHKANGFSAFKMRIGSAWGVSGVTMERFARLLHKVRAAMDPDDDLMLDANSRFRTAQEAIEVTHILDDVDARWFEDPLNHHGPDGPALINEIKAHAQQVAISGGETYHSLEEHQRFLKSRAFEIVHVDSCFIGLTHAYKLARLYHEQGLPCIPHSWTNAVAHAANAHLVAAIPNRVMLETQQIDNPMLTELVDQPIPVDRGYIDVPERPGLGIELDEGALERYPYVHGPITEPWNP